MENEENLQVTALSRAEIEKNLQVMAIPERELGKTWRFPPFFSKKAVFNLKVINDYETDSEN